MKLVHNITVSVFIKGEGEEEIRKGLLWLLPFDLEKEKLVLERSVAEGLTGDDIIILKAFLEKERHTKAFLNNLLGLLGEEQRRVVASQEDRVDEECFFYLRLDKKQAMEGKAIVTESGDCYHVKMHLAAFPANREAALGVMKKLMSQNI